MHGFLLQVLMTVQGEKWWKLSITETTDKTLPMIVDFYNLQVWFRVLALPMPNI